MLPNIIDGQLSMVRNSEAGLMYKQLSSLEKNKKKQICDLIRSYRYLEFLYESFFMS